MSLSSPIKFERNERQPHEHRHHERQPPEQFDVLAVDAFSSDAIPVHLLTLEAFQLYFHHLKPDGVLAVHISNRYLNLASVVVAASERLDKDAMLISNQNDRPNGVFLSNWILVANRGVFATLPGIAKAGSLLSASGREKPWTDSYSSLFAVLK